MSVPEHFADCFNYYLFKGEQIVKPGNLQPLYPTEIAIIPEDATNEKVMKYIAVSKDKKALEQLQHDDGFKSIDVDSVRLLKKFTNSKIAIQGGEKKMDMCRGLKELLEDKWQEGILLTKKVQQLQREGKSNDDIAKECDIPVAKVKEILE